MNRMWRPAAGRRRPHRGGAASCGRRLVAALCCSAFAPSFAAVADEGTPPEATAAAETAPAGSSGIGWGVDGFGAAALLTLAPQTAFYQGVGGEGGIDARVELLPWLGIEAVAQYVGFGGNAGGKSGGAFLPAGGLRFDPLTKLTWGTVYLSAHAGYALTGPLGRFGFDAAVGVEWWIGLLRLGPMLRFIDVTSQANATEIGGDARIFFVGFSIGLGPDRTPPPEVRVETREVVKEKIVERVVRVEAPSPTVGALKGRVLDLDEQPLQAKLTITPEAGGEAKQLDAFPAYDTRLPPGEYHLEASAPGYLVRGRDVTLKAGETVLFDFTLRPVPKVQTAVLTPTQIEIKQTIQFAFNKAELLKASSYILDEVTDILLHHRDLRIRIEGHTDDVGGAAYNLELSQQRVDAVRSYLVGAGIRGDRLEVRGYGSSRPISSNATEAGRARNRRVQFKIISSAPGGGT